MRSIRNLVELVSNTFNNYGVTGEPESVPAVKFEENHGSVHPYSRLARPPTVACDSLAPATMGCAASVVADGYVLTRPFSDLAVNKSIEPPHADTSAINPPTNTTMVFVGFQIAC